MSAWRPTAPLIRFQACVFTRCGDGVPTGEFRAAHAPSTRLAARNRGKGRCKRTASNKTGGGSTRAT